MWKHIQRVVVAGGVLGGLTFWLSTNSIPDTIVKADGFLRTNLIWLGWLNPPSALASSAADHTGVIVGLILMVMALCVLLLAGIERVFGATAAQKIIGAPGEAVRYIERHIHHKEMTDETKATASLDMAVHRAPRGNAPLTEGLAYIYTGEWGGKILDLLASATLQDGDHTVLEGVYRDFEQGAFDGRFGVWGKQENSDLLQPIPKEHWAEYRLDALHTGHDVARSENRKHDNDPGIWLDLMVCKAEFEREWPPQSERPESKNSTQRRAHISDCRKMIAEYDGGHGLSNQRKAMYKNVGFLAIKSHLPDHFLATLNKNIPVIVDSRNPDIPVMMNALNSHLSRLEKEWGLE